MIKNPFATYNLHKLPNCKSDQLDVSVQVKCGSSPEIIDERKIIGLIISCLGVFGTLFFTIGITKQFPGKLKINKRIFKKEVVSAKDYTVYVEISES